MTRIGRVPAPRGWQSPLKNSFACLRFAGSEIRKRGLGFFRHLRLRSAKDSNRGCTIGYSIGRLFPRRSFGHVRVTCWSGCLVEAPSGIKVPAQPWRRGHLGRSIRHFVLCGLDGGRTAGDFPIWTTRLLRRGSPRERLEAWCSLQWRLRGATHGIVHIPMLDFICNRRRDRGRTIAVVPGDETWMGNRDCSIFRWFHASRLLRAALLA
jgi:hypothetical protein